MKRTQIIELLSNIRATWVSFVSIVMFVALGIGLYSGLAWTGEALQLRTANIFEENNLHTFEMTFPYGFTAKDIKAVKQVEGVSRVDAGYLSSQTLRLHRTNYTVNVRNLPKNIDKLTVVEGKLPANKKQIAIETIFAQRYSLKVGDTISFKHDLSKSERAEDADGMKYLKGDTYKITALVQSPAYLGSSNSTRGSSTSGTTVDSFAWTVESAFDRSAFNNSYVTLLVDCDSVPGSSVYSNDFSERVAAIKSRIAKIGKKRAQKRYKSIIAAANAEIDAAEAKLKAAQEQISSGSDQIDAAQKTIKSKTRELEDAQLELKVTSKLLSSQKKQTEDALNQVKSALDKYDQLYQSARSRFDAKIAQVKTLKEQTGVGQAAIDSVNSYYEKLASQKKELDDKLAAGTITQEEYDKQLKKICDDYNAGIDSAHTTITENGGEFYNLAKENIDAFFDVATIDPATFDDDIKAITDKNKGFTDTISVADKAVERLQTEADNLQSEMDNLKSSLDSVTSAYEKKRAEYEAKIAKAEGQVASGKAQLASGKKQLKSAQSTVDEKRNELKDARAQYKKGRAKLKAAKEQVSQTVEMNWVVISTEYNGAVMIVDELTGMLDRLRMSMAGLFVIVGLFVCYSAVSRIVHEQITQLGTKKAIGFRASEITLSYLAYSGLAVMLGAAIGAAIGMLIVEPIAAPSLNWFVFETPNPIFTPGVFALVTAIDLVLILASTWLACRGVLKRNAIELLQGEKPPANRTRFYEKWNIWQRLGLFTQTVVNNCINDKRRVFATLVGVAGCTALIVVAVTLSENTTISFDRQLNDIYGFDSIVYCNPTENDKSATNSKTSSSAKATSSATKAKNKKDKRTTVDEYLTKQGMAHTAVKRSTYALNQPNGRQSVMNVYVTADPEGFGKLFHMNTVDYGTGSAAVDGAWVSEGYANYFHVKVGDTIQLQNAAGQTFDVPIAGFFEFHSTMHFMVLSSSAYERIMGSDITYNAYIVKTDTYELGPIRRALRKKTSDFVSISSEKQWLVFAASTFSKLSSTIVAIYVVLSAVMALIVLLNLNIMFIEEKKRELIVLMINGYSLRDAKRYIYRDNIAMTAVGIVLGCAVGMIMGYFSVQSAENSAICLIKDPSLKACLVAAALCSVFCAIVTAIALRRISKFKLTDIGKM